MNFFKTFTLLSGLTALLMVLTYLWMGNLQGILIGLAIGATLDVILWFYSDKIALKLYEAKPPTRSQKELLQPIVESLSFRANLPCPKIYVIPTELPNAFATGRDYSHSAIAVTEGIIKTLSKQELEAVIAHEMTHIKNRDTATQTIAAILAGSISLLSKIIRHSFGYVARGRNNNFHPVRFFILLLSILLAPLTATIVQLALSRTREYAADAGAARLTGNPRALANALDKITNMSKRNTSHFDNPAFASLFIINPISGEFLSDIFSTHPSTEARIQQLLNLETGTLSTPSTSLSYKHRALISAIIAIIALVLAYAPLSIIK